MSERVDALVEFFTAFEAMGSTTLKSQESLLRYLRTGGPDGKRAENPQIMADMQSIEEIMKAASSKEEARARIAEALSKSLSPKEMTELGDRAPMAVQQVLVQYQANQAQMREQKAKAWAATSSPPGF